ncbi:MAG: hypothetical protein HKP58_10180 [Desulfatitalea sp.]|nr:hypothetical protein [Desulfatitalea sp.]NNK00769.1 hypothetical protein [Desulfatitalea sp.]
MAPFKQDLTQKAMFRSQKILVYLDRHCLEQLGRRDVFLFDSHSPKSFFKMKY